jgi:hypothetical protein
MKTLAIGSLLFVIVVIALVVERDVMPRFFNTQETRDRGRFPSLNFSVSTDPFSRP